VKVIRYKLVGEAVVVALVQVPSRPPMCSLSHHGKGKVVLLGIVMRTRRRHHVGKAKLLDLDSSEEAKDDPTHGRVGLDLAILRKELGALLSIPIAWHREATNVVRLPFHDYLQSL